MMSRVRYIGSKARVVRQLCRHIGPPSDGRFVDLFSGTGIVSKAACELGWRVHANDHLVSSFVQTTAQMLCESQAPFSALGGYEQAIQGLNASQPKEGFFHREYTPAGRGRTGDVRKYFTCENGQKLDGVRHQIKAWSSQGMLSDREHALLLADLIEAANSVANIAGTYGSFLREWYANSLDPLRLLPRPLRRQESDFRVSCRDVLDVQTNPDDLIYIDPPYTKRQYAAYYHIPETIAVGVACPGSLVQLL